MQHKGSFSLWLSLFWSFLKIGPATFGGGYAMIPLIEREAVARRQWVEQEEMDDMLSLAGSAPGGVGVNAAAIIGYRLAGVGGAAAAVAGISLPAFAIVFLLSLLYAAFQDYHKVQAALQGIQGAVIALIILAALRMAKSALFDVSTIVIAAATVGLLIFTTINPATIIIAGLFVGIILIQLKKWAGLEIHTEKEKKPSAQDEIKYPEYYI